MRRYIVCLVSLACLMVSGSVQAQQTKTLTIRPQTGVLAGQTAYTNSYAIIIGIGKYAFLPQDKHLDFAAKDATDLRDLLIRNYGFPAENVTVLLDAQATRANIEAALAALADDKVKSEDRVLV
ncbi:MAG: putative xylanase/chitin deacetylase, partial [Chthonomonadaceae bacterium]|nr:putative xylanase/chitin deacetylase [Chthonomonadaceae bacterium]